jgi:hypothetical protein
MYFTALSNRGAARVLDKGSAFWFSIPRAQNLGANFYN